MNGETTDADAWRRCSRRCSGRPGRRPGARDRRPSWSCRSRWPTAASRSAARFAARSSRSSPPICSARRAGSVVRRERRILFDGVRAEIHPYDVTVERAGSGGARLQVGSPGINADVLHQLDDARAHAAAEDVPSVALVVFDAERSCASGSRARPRRMRATAFVTLESLDRLATGSD